MSQDTTGNPPRPQGHAGAAGGARVRGFSPLPTGTRIGELAIQSVLGAGEFAITYVTEHEKRSKRYVLKEYFPRAIAHRQGLGVAPQASAETTYAWGLDRFLSEARLLQGVDHPAVVSVLGITRHGGTGYIGMAYEAGVDFSIWLHERKRVAPQDDLDAILAPLLEGLAKAHAAKAFHFDLSPDSIIVRESGTPVLVDFGVFRVGLRRRLPPGDLKQQVYAAPELLAKEGGPIGPWTDIYSLAGLLYLAVTGRPPISSMERGAGTEMPSATTLGKGRYRADMLAAIDAGLRLPPTQRPRTVAEFADSLLQRKGTRFSLTRLSRPSPVAPPVVTSAPPDQPKAEREQAEPVSLGGTPVSAEASPAAATAADATTDTRTPSPSLVAAAGAVVGVIAGVLLAYVLGGLLRQDCGAESCAAPFILPLGLIGAAIGAWEAYRYASRSIGGSSYEI